MEIDIKRGSRGSASIRTSLLEWVAVYGCMCLGLRHSESFGPGREVMLQFLERLGDLLVTRGMFTQAELDAAMEIERDVRIANSDS